MALKVQLSDLASLQNEASATNTINENNRRVEDAIENTLSRDGTAPNAMRANLDMNSNRILNLPEPVDDTEPVRLGDTDLSAIADSLTEAAASATAAASSASAASSSASTASTQATDAATSATSAATQATDAATSATNAATSASNASTSASSASSSATSASTSATAAAGASPALMYNFDSATADADPGAGDFRFNNAAVASVTAVYLDNTDRSGSTVTGLLDTWDDSTATIRGYLHVRQADTPTAYAVFSMTGSVTDGTGYRKLTVSNIAAGAGSFTNGSACSLMFIRAGDAGSVDFNAIAADTIAAADLLLFGDASDSNNANTTTVSNFYKSVDLLTAETAVDTADEVLLYDASATTADKATVNQLLRGVTTFTAETSVDTADELLLIDTSAGTADKCTVSEFFKSLNTLTADTDPDPNADAVVTYDSSAGASKKVLLKNLKTHECLMLAVTDETTVITTGTAKVTFRMPYAFTVTDLRASLTTASTSGVPTVDINEGGTTIISTKLTIDANELTSTTAAAAYVLSDSVIADDASMTIDIDVAGTGAKGLKVYIYGYRT